MFDMDRLPLLGRGRSRSINWENRTVAYWYQTEPHAAFETLMERKERWPR